ncbi:MAG: hypothetical protein ACT4OU_08255 [Hyphomicrobium sp.]
MVEKKPVKPRAKSKAKVAAEAEAAATLSEADEIAAMLPWYVTGRISDADRARIDAYADKNPQIMKHIAVAREEADAVFAANQAVAPPRAALYHALEKLHASIAADPRARIYAVKTSILEQVGDWLAKLGPRQLAYAGLAAAALVAVQAASIGALLSRGAANGFEVATAPGSAAQGTYALVAFQQGAPAGALSAFLAQYKFTIVEGPISGGVYRVRLGDATLTDDEIGKVIDLLKERGDLVSFASLGARTK